MTALELALLAQLADVCGELERTTAHAAALRARVTMYQRRAASRTYYRRNHRAIAAKLAAKRAARRGGETRL